MKIADDSLKIAKRGFWLAAIVALLTMLGFVITTASWRTSGDTTQHADKRAEQIARGLSDVKTAVTDSGRSSSREVNAMLNELKVERNEQAAKLESILKAIEAERVGQFSKFETVRNEQAKMLERQAEQSAADQKTIENLCHRVEQLENDLRNLHPTTAPK